jgi:hypothetical protein
MASAVPAKAGPPFREARTAGIVTRVFFAVTRAFHLAAAGKFGKASTGNKSQESRSMPGDPWWMHVLLAVHVAAGAFCLAVPLLVLSVAKGGPTHRRWGRMYLRSIGIVAATALAMALYRPVLFLALIAELSFYLAFSGWRVLKLKRLAHGGSAAVIDWMAAILTCAACTCLIAFALVRPGWVQHMGLVTIVLGAVGIRTAGADLFRFARRRAAPTFWLDAHIGKFLGSYIAVWTAFSTVTLSRFFPHAFLAVWLWPAAIGLPAIALTIAHYRRSSVPVARILGATRT